MKSKYLVFPLAALLFSAGSFLSCGKSGEAESTNKNKADAQTAVAITEQSSAVQEKPLAPQTNVDIVYYFMTTQRCPSCMKIEAYSKEAVEQGFADALKKGSMIWRMVNVDQSENNHFIKDYELYTKSVVLVKMRDGKQVEWKNLDRVWELLGSKTAFQKYVTDETKKFVEKS